MSLLDPHAGGPCTCDWVNGRFTAAELMHRPLAGPDQARYGTATDDPLGRDGDGWHTGTHGLPVRTRPKPKKKGQGLP